MKDRESAQEEGLEGECTDKSPVHFVGADL